MWGLLCGAYLLGAVLLSVPAWLIARSRWEASWGLFLIGVPAMLTWIVLMGTGVGSQGVGNLLEFPGLAFLSVVVCYSHALFFHRYPLRPVVRISTSLALTLVLVGVAVLLRLFMPEITE